MQRLHFTQRSKEKLLKICQPVFASASILVCVFVRSIHQSAMLANVLDESLMQD